MIRKDLFAISKRLLIPFIVVIIVWSSSLTSLYEWMDYRVNDGIQKIVADEIYFTDTLVVNIDDASLGRLEPVFGNWPYSRDTYSLLLDYLNKNGVKNVVFDILFYEARDKDEIFNESIKRNLNAILIAGSPSSHIPISQEDNKILSKISWKESGSVPANKLTSILLPNSSILNKDKPYYMIGLTSMSLDSDGIVRRLPALYKINDILLPSIPLRLQFPTIKTPTVSFNEPDNELNVENSTWKVGENSSIQLYYPKNSNSIMVVPFYKVIEAALSKENTDDNDFFKNKTVIIGSTAYLSDLVNTPRGSMSGAYLLAIANESMKNNLVLSPVKPYLNLFLLLIALLPSIYYAGRKNFSIFELLCVSSVSIVSVVGLHVWLLDALHQNSDITFALLVIFIGNFVSVFYNQFVFKKYNKQLIEKNKELSLSANTDTLTGLFNRRAFLESYLKELERANRQDIDLPSIAMMDLDHFKNVNDTYGHDIGDKVLEAFSKILKDNLRSIDIPARWGGEEFVVLMPSTSLKDAATVLDRVRKAISQYDIETEIDTFQVTVSIGIATIDNTTISADDAVKKADELLYIAKDTGRNKICSTNA